MRVLVLTTSISERLNYTLRYFSEMLQVPFVATTDRGCITPHSGEIYINYTNETIEGVLQVMPEPLLFEQGVCPQKPVVGKWGELGCIFFQSERSDEVVPFDIFAATFYMLSRYEEYTTSVVDSHGRFPCEQSIAYKAQFLHRPIVDLWAMALLKILCSNHKIDRKAQFVPTIDVDHFYKYRRRGVLQTVALSVRDVLRMRIATLRERWATVLRMQQDAFFNFNDLEQLHQAYGVKPIVFFHVGGMGKYDQHTLCPQQCTAYQRAIRKMAESIEVGVHISYKAAFDEGKARRELQRIQSYVRKNVVSNRFHYLRFSLPQSYQYLQKMGIESDYSMLHANAIGFRAGTSLPFYFFDLTSNQPTMLKIHPTALMDTFLLKQNLNEELKQKIDALIEDIRVTHGVFTTLFHNEHLANLPENRAIIAYYTHLLTEVKQKLR